MHLSTILIVTAIAVSTAWGQNSTGVGVGGPAQEPPSHQGYEAQVIHVKTLTGDSFNRLENMLKVFGVGVTGDENLRTIVVYGPKDVVAQMQRVAAELDTPGSEAAIGRNIEMTMTLLRCSTKEGSGAKLPDDIEPVAKQLRAATQYKDIELWDVIPLRLQEGKQATEDMTLSSSNEQPAVLNIRIVPEAASRKGQTWSVRFSLLDLGFKIPVPMSNNSYSYQNVGLNTSGDFQEGQKTVLGKVSGLDKDSAIFVVISLKVLE